MRQKTMVRWYNEVNLFQSEWLKISFLDFHSSPSDNPSPFMEKKMHICILFGGRTLPPYYFDKETTVTSLRNLGQMWFNHHTLYDTLVSASSLSNSSWSDSRLRQKQKTFHIPENTSTVQQLQTLTKSIIVRHKGRQAHTHTQQTLSCTQRLYSQKHTLAHRITPRITNN